MRVKLEVDGEEIELNAFTQEIIANVSAAMAGSLRGVGPDWTEMEIKIER